MSKKRRKSRKNNKNTVIAVVVVAVLAVAALLLIFGNKDKTELPENTESAISTTLPEEKPTNATDEYVEPVTEESTEKETAEEDTTKAEKESTTIPTAAQAEKPKADLSDMIVSITSHYEEYMGMDEGILFIKESEAVEREGRYEFVLRSNSGSPNKYIGDVYVDIETGKVTDTIGGESWTIEMWY